MGQGRILVAEDNGVNQKVVLGLLRSLGYHEVEVVDDGQQAVEAVRHGGIALVFMDCQMPLMDGFEATRAIRADEAATGRARVPVLAMTANTATDDRDRCQASGMDDFVAKPVLLAELKEKLEQWLGAAETAAATENGAAAPVGAESAESVLDAAVAAQARSIMGNDFTLLVSAYQDDGARMVEQLHSALEAGDHEAVRRTAHRLKGASGNIGAHRVGTRCQLLEQEAAAGRLAHAALEGLAADFKLACEALERFVHGG